MSATQRGRGTPRPLYVAPPQRTGIANERASHIAPPAGADHAPSTLEAASRGPAATSVLKTGQARLQIVHSPAPKHPPRQSGLSNDRASQATPAVAVVQVLSAAEVMPSNQSASSSLQAAFGNAPHTVRVKATATGKGQVNKQHSTGNKMAPVGVATAAPALAATAATTPTEKSIAIISACMCISSAVAPNADKAVALKELDASIRSSSLAALTPSFPPDLIPSLALSMPPLVFSGSAGIRALALAVIDGLGCQKCPGWNPEVFLVTCFQILEALSPSNSQFMVQCLSFLISKCSSSWVEPSLSLCLLQLQQLVDNLDNPRILMQVMRIFIVASAKYPAMFRRHMKSVLKMLLGWCLDVKIGLEISIEVCNVIVEFGPVLSQEPDLIQAAIKKIDLDLERACVLRSVDFRVPVLTQLLCKLHECCHGTIEATEYISRFSPVLSSLSLCIEKCGVVGQHIIRTSLVSLWFKAGLIHSKPSAHILAHWFLFWEDETKEIDEDQLSLIVNGCFHGDTQISKSYSVDWKSNQATMSFFADSNLLSKIQRFFSRRSAWFLQCTRDGRMGQFMRILLLKIADALLSPWSSPVLRRQFLSSLAELADSGNGSDRPALRISALQALLFPSIALTATPSPLLLQLFYYPPAHARMLFLLLNNIMADVSPTNPLKTGEFISTTANELFDVVNASIPLIILMRDSELHADVEIHRVVSDTLSLMVYTVGSTFPCFQTSTAFDTAVFAISSLVQSVEDEVSISGASDDLNTTDRRLLDDELVDAISEADSSHFVGWQSIAAKCAGRFHSRSLDHSAALALMLLLDHPSLYRMSIGSLDAIILLLLQCCDSFGADLVAAVSKQLLYLGISLCGRINSKTVCHIEDVEKGVKFTMIRRIFAAVGNLSGINGEGCSNKIDFVSEPTPIMLLSCMWTLASFSLCDLSPGEIAVVFCDALMYGSFSFDFHAVNSFSDTATTTDRESSIDVRGLSSDQIRVFMTYLTPIPSNSLKRGDEPVTKIPYVLHSLSRRPSPKEISSNLLSHVRTIDNLPFAAASSIIAGRLRGGWGGAKEFFDWLTSVSQTHGQQPPLQQQLISSLVCAIQRLSCAASKPVLSPQGTPLDAINLYFSQNYRTIESHCHRVRAAILERPQFISPYDFHEHFKERLKIIVRSAAIALDKRNTVGSATPHQIQIASRNPNSSSAVTSMPSETAMQELEALVISAAHFCLRLMSPEFSNCLMYAARSSASRITGSGSNSVLSWTKIVSLMSLGSYEEAFDSSIQELQHSCSTSLRGLLIDCACTCVTRLLNHTLFTKLESIMNEDDRSISGNFALASSACAALSSWDRSFDVLQKMRAGNVEAFERPSAVSGFSLGLMSCISSSVVAPSSATKEISDLSIVISESLAKSPDLELACTPTFMSNMAILNMIDSRQPPPNLGLFSHTSLWAITLVESAFMSSRVEENHNSLTAALKYVKTLRKHGCNASAVGLMEQMNVLVRSRPEFLIEHSRCIAALGGNAVSDALTALASLSSELRTLRPELSMKTAVCAYHHMLCCDRATLTECSKLLKFQPCSLLPDAILASPHISYPQKFLLNSIAGSIADVNSGYDCPLPTSLHATHRVCKHLSKLWFLLGSTAFRITSCMFHLAGNTGAHEDEYLQKFIGTQMPEYSKLSDREILAAAIHAQNIWIEQGGNRLHHAIQPRSATEVDACLRSQAEKNTSNDVLTNVSHDIIFRCWKRVYSHQQHLSSLAAKSFLACLQCNVARESTLLDVVLKLLRIIGCYSAGIDHVLQDGLSTSPPNCWVRALPQLVAQLSHASDRIAGFAAGLLSNIAREFPNRVLYTAVCSVGLDATDPVTSSREWRVVLKELEKRQPHAVSCIRRMASELMLLSVLPEEKLLASVAEIVSQLPAKTQQYTKEVERAAAVGNATSDMQTQRYLTVFRPLLISLESALHTFSADCSNYGTVLSSHQVWLNHNILPFLKTAVECASAPVNLSDIGDNWKPLRSVGQKVQELIRRRASIDLMSMSNVLSGDFFSHNRLPMPPTSDASSSDCDLIISGIENCIFVMRTKTLPKKVVFQSSIGSAKIFLLKGREDLNLDERMMQFVDVANLFFKDTLPSHSRESVRARKYCVTPLSKRAGLIEWINNCSSLMQLYESGVSARAAAEAVAVAATSEQKQPDARHAAPFKPVDYYTQQLHKALADIGINSKTVPRNQWPKEVLLKLYRQMAESAPRSVFYDALWSSSNSSLQWWTRHVTFSRSLAVSSMIGYVIGLGDRHLDNILLDLRDGSVLHIDWNVCFEKGLRLAIPETVPFRLTPGLQYALGPGGTEGVFSNVATQCMEVLRDNRDILMTLLETFVHDPLLDWATALRTRRKRHALEVCVNFSLLAARLEELLDAVQIKRMPFCAVGIVGDESPVIDSCGVEVLVDDMQKCMSLVHDSQLDVSMARYSVSAAATEVYMRQSRCSALKHFAKSYSARLAPEKSKATARSCRQEFMRLVITEEAKIATFSEFLISLQQPSQKALLQTCGNFSRPSLSAHPPAPSSWRIKKTSDSNQPVSQSEWNRLVAVADQAFANLDSAVKESCELLFKYMEILSPFSPTSYARMTLCGEWSRIGRAVVNEQDNLDGRSAIMAFSSFTCNTLLQTRKDVAKYIATLHEQTLSAATLASLHLKTLDGTITQQHSFSMTPEEMVRLFNSYRERIETHPFEALSTTEELLKQSFIDLCQRKPSLSDFSSDSNLGHCEWFGVVQKLYVPVVLTWLAVDSNSALAYLQNQSSMPLPYPCCTFCHELQMNSLSEVIRDPTLCDRAFLACKAWNIVSSSWLCSYSISSQLAHQLSVHAVAVLEIQNVAAAIAVFANTSELSSESWLSFLRYQSQNAIASVHTPSSSGSSFGLCVNVLQTVSAIYGWCTPLIDWFDGLHQPECLRSWLACLVDVFKQLFSNMGADAFVFRLSCVEKAFHAWLLLWTRRLFEEHNLFSGLLCLPVAQDEKTERSIDICDAITVDLMQRVNHSCTALYKSRKQDVEGNLQQQQQLFQQILWTKAPIIQLSTLDDCPAILKAVEAKLPPTVGHVQACLASFLSAHLNITSREDSQAHIHTAKQPEIIQRRAMIVKIKENVLALLDVSKKVIDLEQQRCHLGSNWFGVSSAAIPSSLTQFLNALASWEAASVFASGGLAKVQEASDITLRALAVSEEAASLAASDVERCAEAASRCVEAASARFAAVGTLQRAEPILSSILRLLAHPAADVLLPSDVATNLKELVEGTAGLCTAVTAHAHVWREAARVENIDELSNVSLCDALCEGVLSEGIKRLCRTQQAVSQAAENVSGDVDEDAVARDREGASLAVKALRRTQKKLSGRDMVEAGLTAKAQVDRAISSATNAELLSRMYEGWTPWI